MKMDPPALCVLQTLLVLTLLPPVAPAPCPRPCSCPQPTELHCTFRSLPTIPAAVPRHVERMNLGFNSINKITDKSLAGLRKLELLMVHGNDIHDLPDGAFRDLTSLQMLKLSYNKLKEINRHTLQGLWSLARLHLDHNRLEFIHPDSFQGLTSLRLLQLEGNQLQQLHPATFTTFTLMGHFHVSTLKHLYLSDNGLTSLPSRLVATMPQLENLYLHGNPWTCDCNMRWFHDWDKTSPGVLKCKKDRALPGGQLCPMCSSPRHLQQKEVHVLENLVCNGPIISSPHRTAPPESVESEVLPREDFKEPFGNVSLALSDEHGNQVDLECSIGEPRELSKITWEQVSQLHLASNITLSVDLECAVDREKYEQLWRLIAYYSSVPAHLQRGIMLSKDPHLTYVYRQDSERDALYYTGVKVNMMAQPAWLMRTSVDIQLNRLQSSAKMVKLILSTDFSETVEAELVQRQRRTWVMIESTNTTRKALSAILGKPSQMYCNVHSSGQPVIQWMLPDGSKVTVPYSRPDNSMSVSSDGRLVIKAVSHTDAGIYYCIARVHGDFAVLPFHLTVQESSSPPPGEDTSIAPIEGFAGNSVSLPCVASGSPDAEIIWILPSSNTVSFQANSSRALVYSNGTLHIPQTQLLDSGYYKCIAINQHGVDTLATKITVVRRTGLIRPLRRFPARPQSASGVNTQIKVPTEDTEEASGDIEMTQEVPPLSRLDPLRRRIPIGVAPGRRGMHPSRNMWRRPLVLRKPTGSRVEDRKVTVDNRRRINMSKSKIDPEKWADILAKIRDRNTQNTVTPLPVQHTTETKATQQTTLSQETIEGSSDGMTVQEKGGRDYYTTARTPVQHTQIQAIKHTTQGKDTHVTPMTSISQHTHSIHATTEPYTTQNTYSVQHTTHNTNLDLHTSSNSVFFLPQTTSVPLHAVTFWQASPNIAGSGGTFSLQENHSTKTDVDGDKTADWSKALERSENADRPNSAASSNNERETFMRGSQIISSVSPNESVTSQEENGKYLSETTTASQLNTQSKETTLNELQSEAMLTTASPTTTLVPSTVGGSDRESRLRQPNSRRRNGGRRRRPNRRKQKLNQLNQFTATTPSNAPLATVKPTASTEQKIRPSEVTRVDFSTTVPFLGSQAASSGSLSPKDSTVSRHDHEAATKPNSLPASPSETKDSRLPPAKPQLESTSAAPSFPAASPGVGHGKTSSQTALSESASPPERFVMLTSTMQQRFGGLPPVKPSEETHFGSQSDNAFGGLHIVTQVQTDVEEHQSGHQYTPTKKDGKMPLNESGIDFSPLPSISAASFPENTITTTSGYTTSGLILIPSMLDYSEMEKITTKPPTIPEKLYHDSSHNETTSGDYEVEVDVDALATDATKTTPPSAMSSSPDVLMPSRVLPHFTRLGTSSTQPKTNPSLRATTQEAPGIIVTHSQDQVKLTAITSEPRRTADLRPAIQSPDHKLTSQNLTFPATELQSRYLVEQTPTSAPTVSTSNPSRDRLLTSTRDASREHQLPGRESIPRGKPRITKNNFQTFTVKAETDAQLPCEAQGEPMPFLSWTNVASGASIAQNTRVERFEVHPNGTLIIRNTQLMDAGQYLCTVQNQYGIDKMVVNLVVLSQHPRVLQHRYRDVTVHLGGKVDLECKVEGHPVPRVTWVLPNLVHMDAALGFPSQQRVVVMNNGTLRIGQASYTDRGIYKCIGSSAAGADTVSVRLYVSALPPVIQQTLHENTSLPEGGTAYIHCTATGAPQPVIRWITPDGIQLTASQLVTGQNLVVFPNGTLYIRGLGPRNAGRYECSASNTVASSRRTVILSIRRNPSSAKASITSSSPQRTDVIYGSKLLLNCVATGEPEPRIIWRTPSKKLVDAQYSFDPRIKVFPNGSITVHSVTDKDSGDYLCVARNKMGDDYVPLRVNVLTRPAKIEQKQQRSRQEVVYGGDLKVDCVASGLPNPEISWALPDGTMVNPVKQRNGISMGRSRRYVVFDNGTLYFNDVGMPEEGDYTCYAENQLGKDEMKVRIKVKVATYPPQVQGKDQRTVRVFYGETVTLGCNTKGEPLPLITWISPTNKVISPALDKYQILDDGTLVVQKAQRFDGGNYTCMARNSAGQDHKVTRLEVLVTPPVINGLRGTTNAIKVTAVQDQLKLVDCMAKGTPTPRIMWVLPGNVILPAPYYSNRMAVHLNGTLEIRSPKTTDSGQLACIARNEGGEVRLVVNLDVKEVVKRPQIRGSKTDSLSLTVGNAMTLNCSLEGSTLPHITWILPSGTPLRSGARFSKFFHRPDGSLIISNPSIAEVGMYRCLGHNSGGLVERTITLSPGRKAEINNIYNSPVSVMNGETLLLHCQASGEPLRLAWTLPSGVVLNRPQRAGRYAILPNGTLAIHQVSVYDRGGYVCRAANEFGSSLLSVSVIVIAYPPRITSGPPSVTYAKRGVAVQLNCVATGIPKVEVAWETPDKARLAVSGQPRLFGNRYIHPQGSLIIQNPTQKDAGIYRCTARNAIGIDSKATFLNVF
ncbi:immunoglobulin superfamily member 10 [Amphiprion ocellaris]|uniref:immunoglobulin superfamily member 10 n=1 Tax=Amphiprion ocellaris TaxID=80972 RepID=UPI0024115515|nr:immunoglobulin superfamily member 10 [Amphiprion ocellaris]XP_035804075.2 immunoglobulin superfamily member 10 [Amphiprion ocellaris]XP_054864488.1 immunoglobulin superfamily member 10 [Amphiprion ocellaris]